MTKISGRTIAGMVLLLMAVAILYVWDSGDKRKNVYYGLAVASCLTVLELTVRAVIRWRYGNSSAAANLLRVLPVVWWIAFLFVIALSFG